MSSKVALVTGSGRKRVGSVVARALAERGYDLAIHYRTAVEEAQELQGLLRTKGVQAETFQADLANEAEVQRLFASIQDRFGQLDVLVNCAAVWIPKRLEETTANDLRFQFDVNVVGTFLCAREAGLRMVAQEQGGCIINVGDWAIERPYLHFTAYFASKGAIPTLTRALAVELGTRNSQVRVNCVMPGPVMLPPELPEAERQEAIGATLVKREGRPENVAQAILALIENDFITGVCLEVDGGRSIYALGL